MLWRRLLREIACRHGRERASVAVSSDLVLAYQKACAVRRMDSPGVFRTGRSSIGRVGASMGRVGRPSDGLFVHRTGWASMGRVERPSDVLSVHRTGWDVHGAHCSFIGRFGRPYGTVSSWRHHALPCSGDAALAAQRCWNAALYPLSLPWQRRSLHFDRHAVSVGRL